MNEVFTMWKKTKMVVLVALCAGLYAAILIPFKGFVLIPGVTEFRPASALPVVMGLLFGWVYHRWGRSLPLIVAHWLLNIVSFVGYPLALLLWPTLFQVAP